MLQYSWSRRFGELELHQDHNVSETNESYQTLSDVKTLKFGKMINTFSRIILTVLMMSSLTESMLVRVPREIVKYPQAVMGFTSLRLIIKYCSFCLSSSDVDDKNSSWKVNFRSWRAS